MTSSSRSIWSDRIHSHRPNFFSDFSTPLGGSCRWKIWNNRMRKRLSVNHRLSSQVELMTRVKEEEGYLYSGVVVVTDPWWYVELLGDGPFICEQWWIKVEVRMMKTDVTMKVRKWNAYRILRYSLLSWWKLRCLSVTCTQTTETNKSKRRKVQN